MKDPLIPFITIYPSFEDGNISHWFIGPFNSEEARDKHIKELHQKSKTLPHSQRKTYYRAQIASSMVLQVTGNQQKAA